MKLAELKSEFHNLIDQANDPKLIEQFFDALSFSLNTDGTIWRSLTSKEQQDVIGAYDDSEDVNNLISFKELKAKYDKWS